MIPLVLCLLLQPASLLGSPPTLTQIEGYWQTEAGDRDLDFHPDGVVVIKGVPFGWALEHEALLLRSLQGQVRRFRVDLYQGDLEVDDGEGGVYVYRRGDKPLGATATSDPGEPDPSEPPYLLQAAGGFVKTSETGGVVRLESPELPGTFLLVPGKGLLTAQKLVEASREGWKDPSTDLRPRSGAKLQSIPMTIGHGSYFEVEGRMAGLRVRGYLGGVFGPEDRYPYLLFATAPPEVWPRFGPLARSLLESVRFRQDRGNGVGSPAGGRSQAAKRWVLGMDLPKQFRQTAGGDGVLFLSSPVASGAVMVLPAEGILTPEILATANREGWHGGSMHLRALRPGQHQKLANPGVEGFYFAVDGEVSGQRAQGFLGGVFDPQGGHPHLVLAFATPEDWAAFAGAARIMLDSIRLDPVPAR